MAEIDDAYITRFVEARRVYNASVVENQINHVFDMYNSEYAYNTLKSAVEAFEALSAEEQALVSNASKLEVKMAELAEKMGKTIDFSLSYNDYFPANEDNGQDDNNGQDDETPNNGWVIVLIVGASVIALAAAAVVTLIILDKKNIVDLKELKEKCFALLNKNNETSTETTETIESSEAENQIKED